MRTFTHAYKNGGDAHASEYYASAIIGTRTCWSRAGVLSRHS